MCRRGRKKSLFFIKSLQRRMSRLKIWLRTLNLCTWLIMIKSIWKDKTSMLKSCQHSAVGFIMKILFLSAQKRIVRKIDISARNVLSRKRTISLSISLCCTLKTYWNLLIMMKSKKLLLLRIKSKSLLRIKNKNTI